MAIFHAEAPDECKKRSKIGWVAALAWNFSRQHDTARLRSFRVKIDQLNASPINY